MIQPPRTEGPEYLIANNKIWLNGVVANQEQAQELLEFIKTVMPLLRKSEHVSENARAEGNLGSRQPPEGDLIG